MKELQKDPAKMKEQAEKSKAWVQQGMATDAKK
jgi:glutathione S-transferase